MKNIENEDIPVLAPEAEEKDETKMNKTQLIQKIAENGNMTKKDAEVALNAVVAAIADAVAAGEKVQVSGFGSFDVKARDARTGRNPKTGEAVEIAASKRVVFSAAQALKDKLN